MSAAKHTPGQRQQCEVILRRGGQDIQCKGHALSHGRCARHGGERMTTELITHRAAIAKAKGAA